MAHIKVVRRSMRPEEWTDLRFGWLKRYIYSSKWEIKNLKIKDARQISENEYEFYSEPPRPLNKGDMYFTPDGTAFITADVDIPEEMQGEELWFSLKTAAEICVKVNGKYVGGVDPNRERMLLSPYVDSSKTLHFEMEGYNRSKPDDERNPESLSVRGCRQIFEGAYICTVNHAVQNLVYDFELLLDIAKSDLFSEDYRAFLNRELNNAMNCIDFESEELTGIADAQKYVDEVIYANDNYRGNGDVALIAHSHLDIAYYWRRIHAVQKNLRTVLIQLRLMDRYPDFKYTHTQPYVYETLEKYYPDVFAELKEKVAAGLTRLMEEDPTITFALNKETREQVLSGLGEQHLDVIVSKLKNKFGVDVTLELPKVAYRETIRKPVEAQGKHKKQSGGHGQFGDVWIKFEPCDSDDLVFETAVVGGAVPKNYFPAVEKGLRDCVAKGFAAGYPMVGLKATLYDGSYHPVDSSEMAFKTAASLAYKNAMPKAGVAILEPIGTLTAYMPDENLGDIMGDVTKRRGRVLGMGASEEKGMQELTAEVPIAEMGDFTTVLRSVTAGRGHYTLSFARYEQAPQPVADKVIADRAAENEE